MSEIITRRYVQVPPQDAQKMRAQLIDRGAFSFQYPILKEDNAVLLPVLEDDEGLSDVGTVVERVVEPRARSQTLKQLAKDIVPDELLQYVKSSFDIIGSIAILEVPEELIPYQHELAHILLKTNVSVTSVFAKDSIHGGEFRTQQHRYLAGVDSAVTVHKENGVRLQVNINDVYFSPRLSTERKRIAQQIRPGENVLVMFSGAAPYVTVFGKNTLAQRIVGVEKNPSGHALGEENVRLNKITNATLHCGDVRDLVPSLGEFDRVIMPLPKDADLFLNVGIPAVKKGGMLHYYYFCHEDLFEDAKLEVMQAATKLKRHASIRTLVRCGQHAPRTYRICIDVVLD